MNGEPSIAQTDPRAYYLWLQTQGIPALQAAYMVQQRFPPPDPNQQAKEQANRAQSNALAQTGGTIGGLLITQEALKGFPTLAGLFGSGAGASTGAVAMPTALGGSGALGTAGAAGATGSTVATPTLVGANIVPGTATTGATTLGSIGSVALPVAAAVAAISNAWETGMKDILRGRGTREDYINQAFNVATGGLPNIALRLLGKPSLGKMMTSGKSTPQLLRDDFRGMLRQSGVADENYNVKLADGSTFNIGLDGKTKYQNVGKNIDGKTTRNAWDVDFSNPLAKFAADKIDPIIRSIYQGQDKKLKLEQYTGMLVNAITSNAKSEKDVLSNMASVLGSSPFAQGAQPNQAGPATRPPAPLPYQQSGPGKGPAPVAPQAKPSIRDILQGKLKVQ